MSYSKPQVVAQNATEGSYAAGCPEKNRASGSNSGCRPCELTR